MSQYQTLRLSISIFQISDNERVVFRGSGSSIPDIFPLLSIADFHVGFTSDGSGTGDGYVIYFQPGNFSK